MKNQKTFKAEAISKNGNFPIEITVWQESLGEYANAFTWEFKGTVCYQEEIFDISAYWRDMFESTDMMKHIGMDIHTKIKADLRPIVEYKQGIDRANKGVSSNSEIDNNEFMIGL